MDIWTEGTFYAERVATLQVHEAADCKGLACTTQDSQRDKPGARREDTELQAT